MDIQKTIFGRYIELICHNVAGFVFHNCLACNCDRISALFYVFTFCFIHYQAFYRKLLFPYRENNFTGFRQCLRTAALYLYVGKAAHALLCSIVFWSSALRCYFYRKFFCPVCYN